MIFIIIHIVCLFVVLLFSLSQLDLLIKYHKKSDEVVPDLKDDFPLVCIQLPIYNEAYVVERLINSVVSLDYPKSKLHIQILDDSTDNSTGIIASKIRVYQTEGFQIDHIRRSVRKGFKAGALEYGMKQTNADYICIFDADFLPQTDFLKRLLPFLLRDEKMGLVQSKWDYINVDYNILTQLQAFALDGHFAVEQAGRNRAGLFMNFNGTAGIWRKKCIQEAGGWKDDTLTEDLDLSYRAQLKGWKFKYLEHYKTPSELPVEMNALKSQQFRWTKGAAECARKNLGLLWSSNETLYRKIQGSFHLLNSGVFPILLLAVLLIFPMNLMLAGGLQADWILEVSVVFLISTLIYALFYWTAYNNHTQKTGSEKFWDFGWKFMAFLCYSIGLSVHNSVAVLEGYIGIRSEFVRTPKFNIRQKNEKWTDNKYRTKEINLIFFLEGILFLHMFFTLMYAIFHGVYAFIPLNLIFLLGISLVFFGTYSHAQKKTQTVLNPKLTPNE